MKKINRMKEHYKNVKIPSELEDVIYDSIRKGKAIKKKRSHIIHWSLGVAAAFVLFVGSINANTTFAQSMINVPVLGSIVEVLTVQTIKIDEERFQAHLESPAISGLENKALEASLNAKYIEENKIRYEQFQEKMATMPEGYAGVDSGYQIKTETDQILSIERYEVTTAASATESLQYDTIDKQNNILITLPSLFKDESYVEIITTYINDEMKRQMTVNEDLTYFPMDEPDAYVNSIGPEQEFYITADHKLVISFDEYEVAPGFMGPVNFEIPSELLNDVLVSDAYID